MKSVSKIVISLIIVFSCSAISFAEEKQSKPSSDLSWLVGHWEGEAFGGTVEEVWQPMSAGTMCGTFKLISGGEVAFYELMIISKTDSGYSMNLKHFNADMTGWEEKDKVISFPFVKTGDGFLEFDGLTYKRIDDSNLQITVDTGHSEGKVDKVVIDCVKK